MVESRSLRAFFFNGDVFVALVTSAIYKLWMSKKSLIFKNRFQKKEDPFPMQQMQQADFEPWFSSHQGEVKSLASIKLL